MTEPNSARANEQRAPGILAIANIGITILAFFCFIWGWYGGPSLILYLALLLGAVGTFVSPPSIIWSLVAGLRGAGPWKTGQMDEAQIGSFAINIANVALFGAIVAISVLAVLWRS